MKWIIIVLLACLVAARATEIMSFCICSGGEVPPSTNNVAQFRIFGIDQVHVWINGTDAGIIRAPFTVNYTSLPAGQTNVLIMEYCDFIKRTGTNTWNIVSRARTYPRRPFR